MKELHPKWNNLTDIVDTPWKLNCSSDDIFYYDIINSEQKVGGLDILWSLLIA